MIELYSWPTPNGHKVHIMLEETGLPYTVHAIDIGAGAQFDPAFLAISPNNRIPAIVDTESADGKPISVFESGAILLYLAEKTGKFMPKDQRGRYAVLEWLMFQMGGIGPMFGQANHFRAYAPETIPYAIDRYTNEARRLYGVLDRRLADRPFVAGDYSIADMAIFPWMRYGERRGVNVDDYPNVKRWFDGIDARPAVERGVEVLSDLSRRGPMEREGAGNPVRRDAIRETLSGAFGDERGRSPPRIRGPRPRHARRPRAGLDRSRDPGASFRRSISPPPSSASPIRACRAGGPISGPGRRPSISPRRCWRRWKAGQRRCCLPAAWRRRWRPSRR